MTYPGEEDGDRTSWVEQGIPVKFNQVIYQYSRTLLYERIWLLVAYMTSHTGPVNPSSVIRAEFPTSRPVPTIVS